MQPQMRPLSEAADTPVEIFSLLAVARTIATKDQLTRSSKRWNHRVARWSGCFLHPVGQLMIRGRERWKKKC